MSYHTGHQLQAVGEVAASRPDTSGTVTVPQDVLNKPSAISGGTMLGILGVVGVLVAGSIALGFYQAYKGVRPLVIGSGHGHGGHGGLSVSLGH